MGGGSDPGLLNIEGFPVGVENQDCVRRDNVERVHSRVRWGAEEPKHESRLSTTAADSDRSIFKNLESLHIHRTGGRAERVDPWSGEIPLLLPRGVLDWAISKIAIMAILF